MSTKALSEQEKNDIKKRVRWAIDYICKNFYMTNEKIGKEMGCATSTINSYRRMITLPGRDFVIFIKKYGLSSDWLDDGKGEPFPGAREKFPEVCGSKSETGSQYPTTEGVHETPAHYSKSTDALFSSNQIINIEEAMGKAYKVLTAGTALSVALYMNIQQFAAALDTGEELKKCRDEIADLRKEVLKLRQEVNRFTAPSTAERQDDGSEKEAM
ncbi:MAG: hypothetical protein LLG40_11365 [Deltaproteobacteria bacterium]|nr:hypothetical protein [Deltaproteobacteria bacterium]